MSDRNKMVYLVIGGSRGIGAAVVRLAATKGHDVAFTYVTNSMCATALVDEVKAKHPEVRCNCYQLDVRNSEAVEVLVDTVASEFGRIDVAVPNAGINRNALAISMSDEDWTDVLDTNLSGAFFVCRQVLPIMMEHRFGRIVLISSLSKDGLTGQANYAASKAGLVGLAKTLAQEYGPRGITTNVVAPGFVETDMTQENVSQVHADFWMKYCPVRRMGLAGEVAAAVDYFASEGAAFTNGTCLPLTGGMDWAP